MQCRYAARRTVHGVVGGWAKRVGLLARERDSREEAD